jgi:hypothetical protein
MNTLTTTQNTLAQRPPETLLAFSIGPACDLAELGRELKAWLGTPIKPEEIERPNRTL